MPIDGGGVGAVRALEVAVLEQRDRRLGAPAHVVALRVDVLGEVDDRLGGAPELARAQLGGQEAQHAYREPRRARGERTAVASTPTVASSSSGPSKASVATSSETVKPIPADVAATASAGQVTVSRVPPSIGRVASHAAPMIPSGLPTT